MAPERLGKLLFTRTYNHGDERELVIRIWSPNKTQVPMFCWYQIGNGSIHRVPGIDPLDALFTAMKTVEMHLRHIQDKTDKDLHWKNAMYEGDLGLPVFYSEGQKQE